MTAKPLARLTMRLACAALIVGAFLNFSDADPQLSVQKQNDHASKIAARSDGETPSRISPPTD